MIYLQSVHRCACHRTGGSLLCTRTLAQSWIQCTCGRKYAHIAALVPTLHRLENLHKAELVSVDKIGRFGLCIVAIELYIPRLGPEDENC